jgi:uncharacterized membrane protein HdeD (DUF308 family)
MKARIPILIDLFKGVAAIVLGILLFFIPDKSSHFLLNTMGFFWLAVGLTFLRRGQDDERYPGKYTALIAGLVAVIAGLLVVTRRFTRQWVGEDVIFFVLGTVILATGLLHIFGEIRIGGLKTNRSTRIQLLLGLFEVLLGALLILSQRLYTPVLYWTATAWAIIYGVFGLINAARTYRENKQRKTTAETADEEP